MFDWKLKSCADFIIKATERENFFFFLFISLLEQTSNFSHDLYPSLERGGHEKKKRGRLSIQFSPEHTETDCEGCTSHGDNVVYRYGKEK